MKTFLNIYPEIMAKVMAVAPGSRIHATPFAVADAAATRVVTVLVWGPMEVPGIVLAASVDTMVVALSSAMVGIVVTAETMLGGIVLPGMTVVYVIS